MISVAKVPPAYRAAVEALRKVARDVHPKGGMQTASGCACGASSGGPAMTEACRGLEYFGDLIAESHRRRECYYCRKQPGKVAGHFGWLCEGCNEAIK